MKIIVNILLEIWLNIISLNQIKLKILIKILLKIVP